MSKSSVKPARRAAKAPRRNAKKTSKGVARAAAKKPARATRSVTKSRALQNRSSQKIATPILRTASPPMQPVAIELPVRLHKYQVGEIVYFNSPSFGRAATTGSYTVIKLLPSEGEDYQYRIKSSGEAFERVAKESQLDKL